MYCIEVKENDGSLYAIFGPFSSHKQAQTWWDARKADDLVGCVVPLHHPLEGVG